MGLVHQRLNYTAISEALRINAVVCADMAQEVSTDPARRFPVIASLKMEPLSKPQTDGSFHPEEAFCFSASPASLLPPFACSLHALIRQSLQQAQTALRPHGGASDSR